MEHFISLSVRIPSVKGQFDTSIVVLWSKELLFERDEKSKNELIEFNLLNLKVQFD